MCNKMNSDFKFQITTAFRVLNKFKKSITNYALCTKEFPRAWPPQKICIVFTVHDLSGFFQVSNSYDNWVDKKLSVKPDKGLSI